MTRLSDNSSAKTGCPDLSVIIVNWNTKELTAQCLRSVLENLSNTPMSYEIIVVDNASIDGSAKMISDDFSAVRLISNVDNKGYVKANNQAAMLARGRYCLLLNSDTQLLDNTMPTIIEYLDNHPEVGIATGKVLNPDQTFQPPYRRFPNLIDAISNHTINKIISLNTPFQRRHKYQKLDPDKIHNVDSVTGAYLFIRRASINGLVIFDEDIFMYYEDTLLCNQIRKQGYQIVYLPYAPIIHYHGMSARQARPDAIYNSFVSSKIYVSKVYGKTLAARYSAIVKISWYVLACSFELLRLIPSPKFQEKAILFRYLLGKSSR